MEEKYRAMLSKISADEGFRQGLTACLEKKRQAQLRQTDRRYCKMKKRWTVMAAALAMLACAGAAAAVLHSAFGAKNDGVEFSDRYPQYVEAIPDQTVGDPAVDTAPPAADTPARTEAEKLDLQASGDGVQVALEACLCDEGFLDLQFRVKLSGEKLDAFRVGTDADWEVPLTYLSFNDPVVEENGVRSVRLGGANYTLTIDGRDVWLRGRTAQAVEKVGVGEYVIQQMWFLGDDVLGDRDEFRVILCDVAVGLGEQCIPIDGGFELTVSRAKAAAASADVPLVENAWSPRPGVTKTVEKVTQTPLQTIFRIRSVYTGVDSDQLDIDAWDYLVYDADGQARPTYSTRVSAEITYADGVSERLSDPGEYDFSRSSFTGATFVTEEIAAAAPVEGRMTLRAYESDDVPDFRLTAVAAYRIDLNAGTVEAEARNQVLYDAGTGEMDEEFRDYYRQRYGQDPETVLGAPALPQG